MGDHGPTDSNYNTRNHDRVRLGISQLYSGSESPRDLDDAQVHNDTNAAHGDTRSYADNIGGLGAGLLRSGEEQVREVHVRPRGVGRGRSTTLPAWMTREQDINPPPQLPPPPPPPPPLMCRPPQPPQPPMTPMSPHTSLQNPSAAVPPLPPQPRHAVAVQRTHRDDRGRENHRDIYRDIRRDNNRDSHRERRNDGRRHSGRMAPSTSNTVVNTTTNNTNVAVSSTDAHIYHPGMQVYQVIDVVAVGIVRPMPPPPPPTLYSWQHVSLQSHHYNVTAETTAYQAYSAVI